MSNEPAPTSPKDQTDGEAPVNASWLALAPTTGVVVGVTAVGVAAAVGMTYGAVVVVPVAPVTLGEVVCLWDLVVVVVGRCRPCR